MVRQARLFGGGHFKLDLDAVLASRLFASLYLPFRQIHCRKVGSLERKRDRQRPGAGAKIKNVLPGQADAKMSQKNKKAAWIPRTVSEIVLRR